MIFTNDCFGDMAPKKDTRKMSARSSDTEDYDDNDDYRKRRDKNNQAVKRSRFKTKQKTKETLDRVTKLKSENQVLEEKVKALTKELSLLKELFLAQAANSQNPKMNGAELAKLLADDDDNVKKR